MGLGKNLRKDNLIPKKEGSGKSEQEEPKEMHAPAEPEATAPKPAPSNAEPASNDEIQYDEDGIAIRLPGESRGKATARRIREKKALEEDQAASEQVQEEVMEVAEVAPEPVVELTPEPAAPVAESNAEPSSEDEVEYDEDGIAVRLPGESRGKAAARRIREKKALEEANAPEEVEEEEVVEEVVAQAEIVEELEEEEEEAVEEQMLLIVFNLGKEEYAVRIEQVKEVVITPAISLLPHEDDHILGVSNVRGNVIAVLDLALKFGLVKESKIGSEGSYTLVVEDDEYNVGLFVESVPNTISVSESEIESASAVIGENKKDSYVLGIIKTEGRMIMLMDIISLLNIEYNLEEEVEVRA